MAQLIYLGRSPTTAGGTARSNSGKVRIRNLFFKPFPLGIYGTRLSMSDGFIFGSLRFIGPQDLLYSGKNSIKQTSIFVVFWLSWADKVGVHSAAIYFRTLFGFKNVLDSLFICRGWIMSKESLSTRYPLTCSGGFMRTLALSHDIQWSQATD